MALLPVLAPPLLLSAALWDLLYRKVDNRLIVVLAGLWLSLVPGEVVQAGRPSQDAAQQVIHTLLGAGAVPLPERDARDSTNSVAMMVVEACQPSDALRLTTLILGTDRLRTVAVDRLRTADLKLDTGLTQRAGLSPAKCLPDP